MAPGLFMPSTYFLVAGAADGPSPLVAFDRALLSVGLGNVNLIQLSSILAPHLTCQQPHNIPAGLFVGAAFARHWSASAGARIGAAISIAYPTDKAREAVIMEAAGEYSAAEAKALATEWGELALKARGLAVQRTETKAIELQVVNTGCVFAAVVQL